MKWDALTRRSMSLRLRIVNLFVNAFVRIAPPMVDEVQQHIQEMLDGGAICPSQSPWCNAIVLVRKKTDPCVSASISAN